MSELIIFIAIFMLSVEISKYTLLINYEIFNKLPSNLQTFKLFICKHCNVFWISFVLGFTISFFVPYHHTLFALISYLMVKTDDIWEYINNN